MGCILASPVTVHLARHACFGWATWKIAGALAPHAWRAVNSSRFRHHVLRTRLGGRAVADLGRREHASAFAEDDSGAVPGLTKYHPSISPESRSARSIGASDLSMCRPGFHLAYKASLCDLVPCPPVANQVVGKAGRLSPGVSLGDGNSAQRDLQFDLMENRSCRIQGSSMEGPSSSNFAVWFVVRHDPVVLVKICERPGRG